MRILVACTLLAVVAGCFPDATCDRDQLLTRNVCLGVPEPSGAGVDAAPAVEHGDGGTGEAIDTMGDVCTTLEHCGPDTDLCAVIPGQASGFCTRSGCTSDPAVCPSGWSCFDASAFVSGLSLCIAQ